MIKIFELANGYYSFLTVWPAGKGIRVHLKLTDPDGDVDERTLEWVADQDTPLLLALIAVTVEIDKLPHWRAWTGDRELSIGPASADYVGEVKMEAL